MEEDIWNQFCSDQNPDADKIYHRKCPINGGLSKHDVISIKCLALISLRFCSKNSITDGLYFGIVLQG